VLQSNEFALARDPLMALSSVLDAIVKLSILLRKPFGYLTNALRTRKLGCVFWSIFHHLVPMLNLWLARATAINPSPPCWTLVDPRGCRGILLAL
jgi:hypothetical protein